MAWSNPQRTGTRPWCLGWSPLAFTSPAALSVQWQGIKDFLPCRQPHTCCSGERLQDQIQRLLQKFFLSRAKHHTWDEVWTCWSQNSSFATKTYQSWPWRTWSSKLQIFSNSSHSEFEASRWNRWRSPIIQERKYKLSLCYWTHELYCRLHPSSYQLCRV